MTSSLPRITFLTTGVLPIPAVCGGAVEGLIETLLRGNEVSPRYDFHVVSIWNDRAAYASKDYKYTTFTFLRPPASIIIIDRIAFAVAKRLLRKRNVSAYRYVFERLWFIRDTARLISSQDFGILVIENHPSLFLALKGRGNAVRYGGRYYYHLHNEFSDLYSCGEIAHNVRSVLCISNFICNSYERLLGNLSESQKKVFMNCVDYEAYTHPFSGLQVSSFRSQYGLSTDDFVFMYSGRITPEKGVTELLQGFSSAVSSMPNARLMIVGSVFFGSDIESDYEAEVRSLSAHLGSRIVFTGYISHDEMPLAYASSDVCCCPSVWEEPACLSVLEGMSAGKPVITTRSGGIPEYTGEGNVILLDRGDGLSERIANAMTRLYKDDELRNKLASKGRARASKFDSRCYLDKFAECIDAAGDI